MRWIKLIAIVSLWLFFFGVLAIVHLWITVLRLPNRWKIVSRWIRGFTWLMRRILNIKITVEGDAGQLDAGGYVIISNHFGYLDGIILGSLFPVIFVSKTGSEKLAVGRSVDDTLRDRFYQSAKERVSFRWRLTRSAAD